MQSKNVKNAYEGNIAKKLVTRVLKTNDANGSSCRDHAEAGKQKTTIRRIRSNRKKDLNT